MSAPIDPTAIMQNTVIQGYCTAVLKTMPAESVEFVLTDPPYFVRYKDRAGRTIRNDRYPGPVLNAFRDVYRVLNRSSRSVARTAARAGCTPCREAQVNGGALYEKLRKTSRKRRTVVKGYDERRVRTWQTSTQIRTSIGWPAN